MRKYYRFFNIFILHLLVCTIFVFLFTGHWSIVTYINILFLVSALYLSIGLLLFVISSGFFDITSKSFHKVFRKKNNLGHDYLPPSQRVNHRTYSFFLVEGVGLLLVMLACLYIYYL